MGGVFLNMIRRDLIRYALVMDIVNVNTYSGYKGGLIVKVTTRLLEEAEKIRRYALTLGMDEAVVKENKNIGLFEVYGITEDDVYQLKNDGYSDRDDDAYYSTNWDQSID
jgi:hypothetical protein